jgi:hypothetical protein
MASSKINAVIEAVRYEPGGRIQMVRLYERRGPVWSDHLLLDRKALVERLEGGKQLAIGQRKPLLGAVFETGDILRLDGRNIVTGNEPTGQDSLRGVPVF